MNQQTARYVVIYHPQFMNERERSAYEHLIATAKAESWRNDEQISEKLRREIVDSYSDSISTDPEVLRLASGGWEMFLERTATRILHAHGPEIFLNRCPRCGEITVTPRSKQCRYCRHDWHDP